MGRREGFRADVNREPRNNSTLYHYYTLLTLERIAAERLKIFPPGSAMRLICLSYTFDLAFYLQQELFLTKDKEVHVYGTIYFH